MTRPRNADANRRDALQAALHQIEKQYGKGAIMRLGADVKLDVRAISTGSLTLDLALGGRGVPRGRVIEVFGPEASGKTTLCLHVTANAQRAGGIAAFIDVEHALDPAYTKRIGVDLDNLLLSQPDFGEQALEITEYLVRSNAVDVIVIDSVAALVPRAELEGDMGDAHVGLQARLMSQALRKLTAAVSRSQTCVVFTNQIREKIGVMFGSPETTPGGRALKFYTAVRMDMRRVATLSEGDTAIGNRVRVKVVKNKIAPPFQRAEFDIIFSHGISYEGDLLDLGLQHKLVSRSGAWYSFGSTRLGQGRERAREFLQQNASVAQEIRGGILKACGLTLEESASVPDSASAETENGSDAGREGSSSRSSPRKEGRPVPVGASVGKGASNR